MSIKVILLQSGEQVITDVKEIVSEEKTVAYLFNQPQKITINKPFLISEEDDERSYEVTFSQWILLSSDKEIVIPISYVVALVEPLETIKEMYLGKVNGESNQRSSTEE
jgi:hypothetical protein